MNLNEETTVLGTVPANATLVDVKQKGYNKRFGFKYPIQLTNKGYFVKSAGVESIKSAIKQLIKTEPGERLMLPRFGVPLTSFLFMPLDEEMFGLMKEQILFAMNEYLPMVKVQKLGVYPTSEFGPAGLPTLIIKLWCQINNEVDSSFDVSIKL